MKKNFTNIILIIVFIGGLSLLLYPAASNYWNSLHQSRAVAGYAKDVSKLDKKEYESIWNKAKNFNATMRRRMNAFILSDEEVDMYNSMLNVNGSGIMGYIEIPKIGCSLPIYHGTSDEVLQVAIGHLEWTSLPVGGENTHTVLSGHRGLPSARLFTDLDRMSEGDVFMLRILDELFTYEVDQILIVEPKEVGSLSIVEGKDLCTLITCTPYGVNSHRLLVRGHRIENAEEVVDIRVVSDAMEVEELIVAIVIATPMILLLLIWITIKYRNR